MTHNIESFSKLMQKLFPKYNITEKLDCASYVTKKNT